MSNQRFASRSRKRLLRRGRIGEFCKMRKQMITPIVGQEYLLFDSSEGREIKSVRGLYLGNTLVDSDHNEWVSRDLSKLEGHVFATIKEGNEIEVYCSNRETRRLDFLWYGEDVKKKPAGFLVTGVPKAGLTKDQIDYITRVFGWISERRSVA